VLDIFEVGPFPDDRACGIGNAELIEGSIVFIFREKMPGDDFGFAVPIEIGHQLTAFLTGSGSGGKKKHGKQNQSGNSHG
jgi:hypothetical protein